MHRKYESMVVFSPSLTDKAVKEENERVLSFIKDIGGEIFKTDEWGKKTLAYEIRKFNEGFYFVNYFSLEPTKINELDRTYRLNENIIRYNLLTND